MGGSFLLLEGGRAMHSRTIRLLGLILVLGNVQNISVWAQVNADFQAHDAFEGIYTTAQAERGKRLFDAACRLCHSDDPNYASFGVPAPGTHSEPGTLRGLWLGDDRPVMGGLGGERGLSGYRTAGELFSQ